MGVETQDYFVARKQAISRLSRWPIAPASLAALIDLGLSNEQIAAYFLVDHSEVRSLRERYGLCA